MDRPRPQTVGDLRRLLAEYPDDTPLLRGGDGYFNITELTLIEVPIRADGTEVAPGQPAIAAPDQAATRAVCLW